MSNAPSKPVSFSRPKVGYFSNRPRRSRSLVFEGTANIQNVEEIQGLFISILDDFSTRVTEIVVIMKEILWMCVERKTISEVDMKQFCL